MVKLNLSRESWGVNFMLVKHKNKPSGMLRFVNTLDRKFSCIHYVLGAGFLGFFVLASALNFPGHGV